MSFGSFVNNYMRRWPDINDKYMYLLYILADQLTKDKIGGTTVEI